MFLSKSLLQSLSVMGHCGKVSKICDCLVGRTALLKTVHAIMGSEAIGVDKNVLKKNNMNFFVIGLAKIYIYRLCAYYIHTAGLVCCCRIILLTKQLSIIII